MGSATSGARSATSVLKRLRHVRRVKADRGAKSTIWVPNRLRCVMPGHCNRREVGIEVGGESRPRDDED